MSTVSAALLTGGLGTRLRSVVSDRPKPLALVDGRPFVTYLLDRLCNSPVSQAVLCTGYLGEMFKSCLGESYGNLSLAYSHECAAAGTAGALRLALPLFQSDHVLVMNGDSYCDVDVRKLIQSHRERKAEITIAVTFVADSRRYGTIMLNDHAEILSFREKSERSGAGLINTGVYVIDKKVIAKIPCGRKLSLERDVFPEYSGRSLYAFPMDGLFIDIGIPEDYERAHKLLPAVQNSICKEKQTT
ncbi:MAG: nucleotidyltransferase family protein [Desulfuromonadales bacterium]